MRHGDLKVWTEEWDGTPVIRAEGEVDLATVDRLRSTTSQIVKAGARKLIFDLRQVTYIDSSGLGVLVATRKHLAQHPGSIIVLTAQPAVLQTLNLTGLDRVLDVRPDLSPASARPGG